MSNGEFRMAKVHVPHSPFAIRHLTFCMLNTDGFIGASPVAKPEPTRTETDFHCPECDYNLTGAPGDRCPWCGWKIDPNELIAHSQERLGTRRVGVVAASAVFGVGSLVVVAALVSHGTRLSLYDGITVLGVLAAAGGHLCVAVLAARGPPHWPIRQRETGDILRLAGWLSVVAGVIGASAALGVSSNTRGVQGVVINGALEFVLRALFFTLPGCTLLIQRMVSLRDRMHPGHRRTRLGAGKVSPQARLTTRASEPPGGAPFTVVLFDHYSRDQLTQQWADERRPTTPAIEAAIARTWTTQKALAEKEDHLLYDGALGRLLRVTASPGRLELKLGPTCYRDFVGTNVHNAAMVEAENPDALANPLGVSITLTTRDGYLAFGRRSRRVANHAGFLHAFGGMLEEADRCAKGYDVFGSAVRELCEELGIRKEELEEMTVGGLVRDGTWHQPELLFEATTPMTRSDLSTRFDPASGEAEHTAIEFVHDDPDAIMPFIERATPVTPIAQAAMLLHGRHSWGVTWYEQTCYVLYGELPRVLNAEC